MRSLFRGIGWRIFLSFSTLLIILVLITSFVGLKFAQKTATDNAGNELRVLSFTLSEQIQKYLKRLELDLKILGASGAFLDNEIKKDSFRLERVNEFLAQRRNNSPNFEDVALFDLTGRCIAATDSNWIGLSAQREPFFINGLKRYGFAEIFENLTQEKILLVSTPINEGMDPHGVVVAQIKLSALYDLMGQKLGVKGTSEAYLLDSKLRLITNEKGQEEVNRENHILSSPLMQHLQDEFWVGKYKNYKGVDVLGTVTKLTGRQWYLVLEKEYSDVEKELDQVKSALFTATIFLLAALILTTIFIAHSITRPLQTLVDGAQRIAAGDFNQPFVVPTGLDEITFLANEFDKMRARIAKSQGRLIEQLAESERLAAIGTLASSLAHEIRNPLNAISLLLSHMERTSLSDAAKTKSVESMRSEIARLDRLVSDILDYSKPLQLEPVSISLKKFFEDLLEFYAPSLEQKKIKPSFKFYSDIVLNADANKLRQAFVNIIQNAMDAMTRGGHLDIAMVVKEKNAEITVRDSGVGIAEGTQRRLFDLFFTTKEKGTGLGLSTVRKIVDAHGGKIRIEKGLTKGTVVYIYLPLVSQS